MRLATVFVAAALSAGLLAGCAATVYPDSGVVVSAGYYDGYYGPYYGGYWGDDGYFYYYADSARVRVVRDDHRHFRRELAHGFNKVEVRERAQDRRHRHNENAQERRHRHNDRAQERRHEDNQDEREERREDRHD